MLDLHSDAKLLSLRDDEVNGPLIVLGGVTVVSLLVGAVGCAALGITVVAKSTDLGGPCIAASWVAARVKT